jgi:hypothetical protein
LTSHKSDLVLKTLLLGPRFFLSFLLFLTVFGFRVSFATHAALLSRPHATPKSDYVARAISDYLTSETGVTIIFESAIVPKWKASRISFKNVYVSRRPSSFTRSLKRIDHTAAVGYDVSNHPGNYHMIEDEDDNDDLSQPVKEELNTALFDLNIDSVDVTLSLWRWLDGKGLVADAVVKGVRGVVGPLLSSFCKRRSTPI